MVHGLPHGIVTLIRTIEMRYGTRVISDLCNLGPGLIGPLSFLSYV